MSDSLGHEVSRLRGDTRRIVTRSRALPGEQPHELVAVRAPQLSASNRAMAARLYCRVPRLLRQPNSAIDFRRHGRYSGIDESVGKRPARSFGDDQRTGAGDRSNAWVSRLAPTGTDRRATAAPRPIATVDRGGTATSTNDHLVADARAGAPSVACSFVVVGVGALRSELVGAERL